MVKLPIVLVASEGKTTPNNIISNICGGEISDTALVGVGEFVGNVYKVITKYYETNVLLVPVETDIKKLPSKILQYTEAFIVYFDSKNIGSSQRILEYVDFVTQNNIGLGILLCDKLFDDCNDGFTYKDIRQKCCPLLDVIELKESDEDDSNAGYAELRNMLGCYVWPTLDKISGNKTESIGFPASASSSEEKLDIFEKLLLQVQTFKEKSSCWERDDLISYAEKLAEQFSQIMVDSDDEHCEKEIK